MPLVGTVLDLAQYPLPILLESIVALDDHLQPESLGSVANLLMPQNIDPSRDILMSNRGGNLLDTHEILFVQATKALNAHFELVDGSIEFESFHDESIRQGDDAQIVEAGMHFPVVEPQVFMTWSE